MHLENLYLKNYRCFSDIDIPLHPKLTVIVAENGQGKSSILDAIRVGMWPFISSFDLARSSSFNDPQNSISIDDVRQIKTAEGGMGRKLPCEITLCGDWGDGTSHVWTRMRSSEQNKSKTREDTHATALRHHARQLQEDIRDEHATIPITLPVFGYYGTGRLWAQKNLTTTKKGEKDDSDSTDFYIRTFGYLNCMDPQSSFKHFREWFIWAWEVRRDMEDQTNASGREKKWAHDQILVVQGVIDTFLRAPTGWHTLRYSRKAQKTLVMDHDEQGEMRVDFLSDGVRSMLAMAGDLAHRCIKLNPHLGEAAARESHGVVLIDEVDMHLHPRWQQLVLRQLRRAFPKIQFIVTTHSPQVLTTVPADCIRIVKHMDLLGADPGTEGAEPSRLLRDVLGLDETRPPENRITRMLDRYLTLVHEDQWSSPRALRLRKVLDASFQGNEPALFKADLHIENRKWELGQ